ncbi:MAG: outer membrane protein transport protein [Thermoanaerobaculia bacterium]|nr:outer membrane protein transport protein [Thermoanaerobaculia bacterium]
MRHAVRSCGTALAIFVAGALMAASANAAGFALYEHGAKAMGMAGAFTAQADDGSAFFFNVAGLAFQRERSFSAGTTFITSEGEFRGADPFPGSAARAEMEPLAEVPSHLYYVQPFGDRATFGLGVYTPFGLTTEWKDKANFPGRYLSVLASLRTFDINPTLAFQLTPRFALGIGAIARVSDVELQRYVGSFNPFTQQVADIAKVDLTSDFDTGYGFNVGLLHKVNPSFSWGLSYRSAIDVEYGGDARFTQIPTGYPQFDAAVARMLPFGAPTPVETAIDFPEMASLGFALTFSPRFLVEVDVNWTGWSSFESLPLAFPDAPALDDTVPQNFEDAYNYRIGFQWTTSPVRQWRFGYVYDETPQPATATGPLLPDADRNGFTVGFGHRGRVITTDLALLYLPFEDRCTSTNRDNFNGCYETTAWLLGATLSF